MFFSNTGEYLRHFTALHNTQKNLNVRLIEKLNQFNGADAKKNELKKLTISFVQELDQVKRVYQDFKSKNKLESKRLYDHDFVTSQFRFNQLGSDFDSLTLQFKSDFERISQSDLSEEFTKLSDNKGGTLELNDYYFQDLPNVAFETVIEHFKSVALYNSIDYVFRNAPAQKKTDLIQLSQANFINKIRTNYTLGESVVFEVTTKLSKIIPIVKWNTRLLVPKKSDSLTYIYSVTPSESGVWSLEVLNDDKRILTSIRVSKPEFRIDTEKSNFDGSVGDILTVILKKGTVLPKGTEITSKYADITFKDGQIRIIPLKVGKISVLLTYKGEIVDEFFVYAYAPKQVDVTLQDISGNNSSITQAYRLESSNTFWQVVGFRMTVITPNGEKKSLKSATRFLRNELKMIEYKAPVGSTIVFDEIRVVGKEKGLTNMGKPIIFEK
jgi:hypothetical protein